MTIEREQLCLCGKNTWAVICVYNEVENRTFLLLKCNTCGRRATVAHHVIAHPVITTVNEVGLVVLAEPR